jgi:hypothetical protein
MEEQLRGNIDIRRQAEVDRALYTSELEGQLRHAETLRDKAVEEAVMHSQESTRAKQDAALKSQRLLCETACLARVAASEWTAVFELSTLELGIVQSDRQVLSVLLGDLDKLCQTVS